MGEKGAGVTMMAILLLALLAPIVYSWASHGLFSGSTMPELVKPSGATQCVEETAYMRANHMNLLMHERTDAVREGVRTAKHSLNNCKNCHEKRAEFCDRCHDYAGASPECFECHYLP